ncbi:MAG: hypothetical protein EA361_01945 [Bacteroidetes bacterium]|nr:MAG: hypothetical protein EA361_01945 [Bacteroidota bacterium]
MNESSRVMNPFAKYIDCLNCGNELINLSELTFRTPDEVVCDFCGQKFPGLSAKVKRTKVFVNFVFIILAVIIWASAYTISGFTGALFALFPLFIIYLFILGLSIKKSLKL